MKNVVYIFGAGSSKDFGMPLGNEIFDRAYKLPDLRLSNQLRTELEAALREADGHMRNIFTKLPLNKTAYPPFEEVLTFLWDYKKSERWDFKRSRLLSVFHNQDGAKEIFGCFIKVLGLTLAGCAQRAPRDSLLPLMRFVRSLFSHGRRVSFISMNYDSLLDEALLKCVTDRVIPNFNYGIPLIGIAKEPEGSELGTGAYKPTGTLLLKPHGSLNLVYCPHHPSQGKGYYWSAQDPIATMCEQIRCPGCRGSPKPLIIPPLYNKAEYIEANAVRTHHATNFRASPVWYRRSVDHAINKILAAAHEIIVIGYSMPPYDYDFRTLFVSSLMQNKCRKQLRLKIITKARGRELSALRSRFEPFVGSVAILSSEGFLDFLRRRGFAERP